MALPVWKHSFDQGQHPAWGSSEVATAGHFLTLIEDTHATTVAAINNVYAVLEDAGNVDFLPVGVPPAFRWLDVSHAFSGTVTTGATVQVFGKLPTLTSAGNRRWPQDLTASGSWKDLTTDGVWIQLPTVSITDGSYTWGAVLLPTTTIVSSGGLFNLTQPVRFDLRGCIQFITLLTTQSAGVPFCDVVGYLNG